MTRPVIHLARRLLTLAEHQPIGADLLVGADPLGVVDVHISRGAPETTLLGWWAPSSWRALFLLSSGGRRGAGRRHPLAIVAEEGSPTMVLLHGDQLECEPSPLTDALQRCLGAPTPPPTLAVAALAARVWLHRLLDLAADHPSPWSLSWNEVARRHPCARVGPGQPAPEDALRLSHAATACDRPDGWRCLARSLDDPGMTVTSALERWFDPGSFERWLLDQLPEPADVLDDLGVLLAPACLADVRAVVGADVR